MMAKLGTTISPLSQKIHLAIVCGGQSGEHEISLLSAFNILRAVDQTKYRPFIIGISKRGLWSHYPDPQTFLLNADSPSAIRLNPQAAVPAIIAPTQAGSTLLRLSDGQPLARLDVAFSALHGPFGEDGAIQGLFKMVGLPYVGCDILSSSMTMDKDITKRLLVAAGISVSPFLVFHRAAADQIAFSAVKAALGMPLFIKPANAGSSLGISKVSFESEFTDSINMAFQYDKKILIESAIQGRELECAVLGNEQPRVSVAGEICVPKGGFYSYEAKYLDAEAAILEAPAHISQAQLEQMQTLAIQAYQVLGCTGLARIDFFLTPDNRWYINEVNTMPGFTNISMYPKLWGLTGIPYAELIDQLIQLGLQGCRAN